MEKTGRCLSKEERITPNRLTKYEKAKLLGIRANQIDRNAPIMIDIDGEISSLEIAKRELIEKKLPLIIERIHANGDYEHWSIDELIIR
jgi:DNA-directed RNA polymerases I, II, and III subunit RPABC2